MRILLLCSLLLVPGLSAAESAIRLAVGESKVIAVGAASKVAVGNPAVADVSALSDMEVLLTAKSPGSTNLLFVSPSGKRQTRTVTVTHHVLRRSMIELAVEIMEIDTTSSVKAGINWANVTDRSSLLNGVILSESSVPSDAYKIGTFDRGHFEATLQLLLERGHAKILAKPKLLTVSGEEASFLAGGEIPYVMENSLSGSKVEWKPYGVKLKMRPTIDAEGNIQATLRAEVSGIDLQNGVATGTGNVIAPAIKSRWAETTVYMKGGSTLVIAGLNQDENQKVTVGIPLLSDLPVLGELFRSTQLKKRQTELVIFVTPSLVGASKEES